MQITEVRIKLMEESGERLQAFCSITFDDCFVIRDLKIIEGGNGPFVAMPSRKLTAHCPQCGCKNHLKAAYCNQCGLRLKEDRTVKDEDGRTKLYADIAHPINSGCREMIQERVIREYHDELERAKEPGYVSRYDDFDHEETFAQPHRTQPQRHAAQRTSPPPRGKPYRRDGYADRPVDRIGPAAYTRSASEPSSHVEPAEQQPRPPHKAPAPQPLSVVVPVIASAGSSAPTSVGAAPVSGPTPDKSESFGAGIF